MTYQKQMLLNILSLKEIETSKLIESLSVAFKKPLKENYLDNLKNFKIAYITSDYSGIAILTTIDYNITYLDKFAVIPNAQGLGLGKTIWKVLLNNHKRFAWRAAKDNSFNTFYSHQANETIETENWLLYLKGYTTKDYPNLTHQITQIPSSFLPPHTHSNKRAS